MHLTVEIEKEEGSERWIAEVVEIPGCLAYGQTSEQALAKVEALALRVLADRLENNEMWPGHMLISFTEAV